ncbi:long-chain fatty acid--CoA ligase [Treponema denticola]|uniref:AMP-binding enzyme family protein n=2 Tax=Treponema denticola TaxID=158 RepID=Q73LX0_TREDE|nr:MULTISPECIES: long-chain fatty acid--CoA ligase [Treponema]AAS12257.1 AMP-binding enzyme family protein [Treponema denticola ATCC 35405]UTC87497.1 long-chain fatty acid--CoA ligase [Treponema denticola]UTC97596.1 long-chain fatty acid--CoA ligase [Treponema denticola]HCY93896.1 long-chain fatty acid--CoA ligase [Treponema sp.]
MRTLDKSLPLLLKRISEKYPSIRAQMFKGEDKEFKSLSYKELYETALDFAAGLLSIGARPKDHIGLIADNRKEWLHASFGIMNIGAADVPRGCDATEQEITHILSFSECKFAVLENEAQIRKVLVHLAEIPLLESIISIDNVDFKKLEEEFNLKERKIEFHTYADIIDLGKSARIEGKFKPEEYAENVDTDDLASIIFTSGTTGNPKGVTMTHRNFMTQLMELPDRIILKPGQKAISVLPVWHSFERACEYVIIISGGTIAYSKPIGSVLLADMVKINPTLFPSVPRIWEAVYDGIFKAMKKRGRPLYYLFLFFIEVGIKTMRLKRRVTGQCPHFQRKTKVIYPILAVLPLLCIAPLYYIGDLLIYRAIRKKFGKCFRAGVSGGGALPPNVDEFFWAIRINVMEGYGITETAPVISVRPMPKPVFGTLGKPLACFESKIIDKNGKELPHNRKGLLLVRGDAVTKGYYKDPERTAEVIDKDGWFDTGDLAIKTVDGELILKGRKKNTIVLRGGENIEPVPIEVKLQESPLISLAVVLGQDQRSLGALIVVHKENLQSWAANNGLRNVPVTELIHDSNVQKMYEAEVAELVNSKTGFKLFERINKIVLLPEEFQAGRELSAKGEMMRHKINQLYRNEIYELFK